MQETMTMLTPNYATVNQPEAPPDFGNSDQAQLEADKRAVYKHPLFPLLALLFERCEQATQSAESPNSESFNNDIQAFVLHQERDRKPFLLNDPEVDGLMIKAIQVLRIHLLELEKVQELCKDFCNRYITCLKGKMQSENLLRSDYNNYENNNNHSSDSNSPVGNYATSPHSLPITGNSHSTTRNSSPSNSPSPAFDYLTPTQPANNLCLMPFAASNATATTDNPSGIVHGSTPLSQIGANLQSSALTSTAPAQDAIASSALSPAPTTPGSGIDDDEDFLGGSRGNGGTRKQKRGVLPKHATSVMRSWLFQHLVHPYPTEDEKRQIASQTNLTLLQVNNWFINARRRILQPMLDASNPAESSAATSSSTSASGGKKKHKSASSSGSALGKHSAAQRFWPDNLAQLQPQLTESTFGGSSDEEASTDESDDEGGLVISDENVRTEAKEAEESEDGSEENTS